MPAAARETVVETPIGTLALDRRLALPPGTAIALTRLGEFPSAPNAAAPPSQAAGWPALDQALAVLDRAAPALAAELRAALAPGTPAALAGTLLFLMGALYRGTLARFGGGDSADGCRRGRAARCAWAMTSPSWRG